MTRRQILNDLVIKENWGVSSKEMNKDVDQVLSDLEKLDLTEEEIEKELEEIAQMHLSKETTDKLLSFNVYTHQAQSILSAQRKKRGVKEYGELQNMW